ncbi:MAG: putative DNA binding domain-containing protein [Methanomassiliicoccaceae archaeon]|jgi:ATP-dependent DNA helicase RecG|nr:putative DNA binding domain-containing protein [Methanomassiliicoccaceae archaeon]
MPLPINIKKLIEQRSVESERIEYKEGWNPEPIIHSICAFANDINNSGGGYIILGIEDDNGMPRFPVKGLDKKKINEINKDLLNKCNTIEPRYIPIVEQTQYDGKEIMIIWVQRGNARPYKCPVHFASDGTKRRTDKEYYIRKVSSTICANENDTKELFSLSSIPPFEERINIDAEVSDLSHPIICDYLCEAESDLCGPADKMSLKVLAENMRIVSGPKENIKPLNIGLLFFSRRPDEFFRYARIEVVDKPDPTGDGMMEKMFTGPLYKQLKDALDFINNYVIKEKIFKYPDRAKSDRFYNYPMEAIEELLANAVFHKSYQIPEPITVVFTPECMEIKSCPGPDRSITDEDLKNCRLVAAYTRNRRIGDMLKEVDLAEGRNTGIPRALRAIGRNGSDMPIFKTDEERGHFTVTLPIHKVFRIERSSYEIGGRHNLTIRYLKHYRSKAELKEEILSVLSRQNISRSRLVERLGYAKMTDGMREAISELMDEGKIEHTIPNNLTDKNQQLKMK